MDANTFKDGAVDIIASALHGTCDDAKMEQLQLAVESVKKNCGNPNSYLRAAFSTLYPGLELNPTTLRRELDDELALIARVRSREKLSRPEVGRLSDFCQEMWYQLRLYENGSTPHL